MIEKIHNNFFFHFLSKENSTFISIARIRFASMECIIKKGDESVGLLEKGKEMKLHSIKWYIKRKIVFIPFTLVNCVYLR